MSGVIGTALLLPALQFLFSPGRRVNTDEWIAVADLDQLDPVRPVRVEFTRRVVDGWATANEIASTWVVRSRRGQVVAFAPECTHLGCAYSWDNANADFLCPCHGSRFDIDGGVKQGPAGKPLNRYPTKVEGRQLLIQPIRRKVS
jgi:menaquinol-cytochrome c reductase iron-sulfur subunit